MMLHGHQNEEVKLVGNDDNDNNDDDDWDDDKDYYDDNDNDAT